MGAPRGADSTTVKASLVGVSAVLSQMIVRVKVAEVCPAANVTTPVVATKSLPANAVPAVVVAVTETAVADGADSVSVKVTVEFLLPSSTVATSPIEIDGCGGGGGAVWGGPG